MFTIISRSLTVCFNLLMYFLYIFYLCHSILLFRIWYLFELWYNWLNICYLITKSVKNITFKNNYFSPPTIMSSMHLLQSAYRWHVRSKILTFRRTRSHYHYFCSWNSCLQIILSVVFFKIYLKNQISYFFPQKNRYFYYSFLLM
jgi:hypothetical protein